MYFGIGSQYNQGAFLGFQFSANNENAFIPGGANGPADLAQYGVTTTVTPGTSYTGPGSTATGTEIQITIPFTYLMDDPDNLGFPTLSAANPYFELRDSQSFSYSYVGGDTFGPDRFGIVMYAPTPEPSAIGLLLSGGALLGFGLRRRSQHKCA